MEKLSPPDKAVTGFKGYRPSYTGNLVPRFSLLQFLQEPLAWTNSREKTPDRVDDQDQQLSPFILFSLSFSSPCLLDKSICKLSTLSCPISLSFNFKSLSNSEGTGKRELWERGCSTGHGQANFSLMHFLRTVYTRNKASARLEG